MEIRTLTEGDGAAWWHVRVASLRSDPHAFGKALEEQLAMPIAEAERRFREVPDGSLYLGAFVGDRLVGMATFLRDAGVKERHKGHIYGVYVDPAQRGAGIGRALIAGLLEHARAQPSLEQVLLAVTTTQAAAKQLYRSFGFVTYGIEPRALKDGAHELDEELMILDLRGPRA